MATDIKLTRTFAVATATIASTHHSERVAIKVESSIWVHADGVVVKYINIWCSKCGKFFNIFDKFNEEHGGE